MRRIAAERPELLERSSRRCASAGPLPGGAVVEDGAAAARARGGTGPTSSARSSSCSGAGGSRARRRVRFERHYDLPERVLPRDGARRADAAGRRRRSASCCAIAARALGVATESDLRDYFRARREGRARRGSPSSSRRATCVPVERRGLAPAGVPRARARACRGRSPRGRWSARSTRWCGSARARSGCSASATGSRSTCPAAQARARLLRAAVPARRPARRARGPQERPPGRRPARAGARTSSRTRRRRPRRRSTRSSALLAGWLGLDYAPS